MIVQFVLFRCVWSTPCHADRSGAAHFRALRDTILYWTLYQTLECAEGRGETLAKKKTVKAKSRRGADADIESDDEGRAHEEEADGVEADVIPGPAPEDKNTLAFLRYSLGQRWTVTKARQVTCGNALA